MISNSLIDGKIDQSADLWNEQINDMYLMKYFKRFPIIRKKKKKWEEKPASDSLRLRVINDDPQLVDSTLSRNHVTFQIPNKLLWKTIRFQTFQFNFLAFDFISAILFIFFPFTNVSKWKYERVLCLHNCVDANISVNKKKIPKILNKQCNKALCQ